MKVTRPVVQMTFTQVNCETDIFAPFFCRIVHRMVTPGDALDRSGEAEPKTERELIQESDQRYICGSIDTKDPEDVTATVHSGDLDGGRYDLSKFPVQFADVLRSQEDLLGLIARGTERLVMDPDEPDPSTPVVVVVDDSRCGWVQAEKWADEYGAIILWWPMVADQFMGIHREGIPTPEIDLWDRGRRVGYRHGFAEGFYQAQKEAEAKNKKKGK